MSRSNLIMQAMAALEEQLAIPAELESRLLDGVAGGAMAQAMVSLEEQLVIPADIEAELLERVAGSTDVWPAKSFVRQLAAEAILGIKSPRGASPDDAPRTPTVFDHDSGVELDHFVSRVAGSRVRGEDPASGVVRLTPVSAQATPPLPARVDPPHGKTSLANAVYESLGTTGVSLSVALDEIRRECIVIALEKCEGNVTRSAALLGMGRARMSQLINQYEISLKHLESKKA